jgi:hypothetical protein
MTLQDLITSALRLDGSLGSGESPSADENADALLLANLIVDGWNGEPNAQSRHGLTSITLTNSPSYALASRPLLVTGARAVNTTFGGIAQPVKVVADASEFGQVLQTSITANWPQAIFVDYGYPTATVYVAPLSGGILYLSAIYPEIASFSTLSDTIALPPGYAKLLRLELAVGLAAEYGRAVPDSVAAAYQEAKASIGTRNQATRGGAPSEPAPTN